MKIPLHGIPEEGLKIPFNQNSKELKASLEEYFHGHDYNGHIELRPAGDHFHMKGHLESELELECSLCNQNFEFPVDEEFQEILAPSWEENMKGAKTPRDLLESDVELITGMEGEDFNLGEYLREVVEFALPAHPKCSDDCKGLCITCGKNLNEGICKCPQDKQSKALAFTVLKDLKIDKKH
jgi:uncharacterized protein